MCETEEFEKRIKDACLDELFETVQIISTCSVLDDEFLAKKADAVFDVSSNNDGEIMAYFNSETGSLDFVARKNYFYMPKKSELLFFNFKNLIWAELTFVDTAKVESMRDLFYPEVLETFVLGPRVNKLLEHTNAENSDIICMGKTNKEDFSFISDEYKNSHLIFFEKIK